MPNTTGGDLTKIELQHLAALSSYNATEHAEITRDFMIGFSKWIRGYPKANGMSSEQLFQTYINTL